MTPLLMLKMNLLVVLTTLTSFYPNISFIYEKENSTELPFLDVLFTGNVTCLGTTVY